MTNQKLDPTLEQEIAIQRQYYSDTAHNYDSMHSEPEHVLALHLIASYIEFYNIKSVLDVVAGTGTTLRWLKQRFPQLKVVGIEPVAALRQQGYTEGVSPEDLLDGDACQLQFPDNSFDLVREFAVLHHIKVPARAVQEMSRVANRMVCISDCNFIGQGAAPIRLFKRAVFSSGLWPLLNWIKTNQQNHLLPIRLIRCSQPNIC